MHLLKCVLHVFVILDGVTDLMTWDFDMVRKSVIEQTETTAADLKPC